MAGSVDIDDLDSIAQFRNIESSVIHPDYIGGGSYINDVCMLTLDSNLEFNDNVKKISLNREDLLADTKCFVSGWGTLTVSYNK